ARDQIAALEKRAETLEQQRVAAETAKKEAEDQLAMEKANFAKLLLDGDKKNENNRTTDRTTIATQLTDLNKRGEKTGEETNAKVKAEKDVAKLQKELKKKEDDLALEIKNHRETREERDALKSQLTVLAENQKIDLKALEASSLDANALKMLKEWKKTWRIVDLDRRGETAYLNIGCSDPVLPPLTFSIPPLG